ISGHMIGMRVAAKQDFDIAEFESQLLDCCADDRNSLFVVAINKDVAFGRCNQERAQLFRSNEVQVADDLVVRKRFVPVDSGEGVTTSSALPALSRDSNRRYCEYCQGDESTGQFSCPHNTVEFIAQSIKRREFKNSRMLDETRRLTSGTMTYEI